MGRVDGAVDGGADASDFMLMNMPERKRRHHIVWKYYLAAWARGELIASVRDGRTFSANATKVAVRTDFYALKALSPLEVAYVQQFGLEHTEPLVRSLNEGWLPVFLSAFQLRHELVSRGVDPAAAEKAIEVLVSNAEEDLHALIERRSIEDLDALRVDDLSMLEDEGTRGALLHYLCVQYFRTPKLQAAAVDAMRGAPGIRGDHIWPILRHIYATSIALGLAQKWSHLRVSLLCAAPGSEFITSDQPVINLFAVGTPQDDEVSELAFFYPISPTRALLIEDSPESRFGGADLTAEEVEGLNRDMFAMCYEQAFATTEAQLQALMI